MDDTSIEEVHMISIQVIAAIHAHCRNIDKTILLLCLLQITH